MFNYNKLKTSALIMLGGIIISVVPLVSKNLIDIIQSDATFDWRTPAVLSIGAFSTWIVASVRNYIIEPRQAF